MDRKYVGSRDIHSIGYDSNSTTLEIEFNSGGIYQYFNVPEIIYDGLLAASSHGQYFHRNIKNVFRYERIK